MTISLAVDIVVIVSAAIYGGAALNRLENVERAVAELAHTEERVTVLENNFNHISVQQDKIEHKVDLLVTRSNP